MAIDFQNVSNNVIGVLLINLTFLKREKRVKIGKWDCQKTKRKARAQAQPNV